MKENKPGRKYPVGKQSFKSIIKGGWLYIDKTKPLFHMLETQEYVFFSRPRRFGKSLTLNTLCCLFEGRKELFKGLWIENQWDWTQKHPVIQLDFNSILDKDIPLEKSIVGYLREIADEYGIKTQGDVPKKLLRELIIALGKETTVVILIDEYDKPIINFIEDIPKAVENREIIKNLYSCIKPLDDYIRFFFITGVSKFSKVSIFSDLNNLSDLTMSPSTADLCGITQEEMESVFTNEIDDFALQEKLSRQQMIDKIRYWYNGFRFSEKELSVYNPFSTLQLMQEKRFVPYWFESGTPTFLIKLIKKREIYLSNLEKMTRGGDLIAKYDVEQLELEPLLLQTGYLTIIDYDREGDLYSLDYPNYEVRRAFTLNLFGTQNHLNRQEASGELSALRKAVHAGDTEAFFKHFQYFFAGIPYDLNIESEKYYQNVFYLVLRCLGFIVKAEHHTSDGRVDLVIEQPDFVWIFEFKLYETAEAAMKQIHEKMYYAPFENSGKRIVLFGVGFDKETRNVGKWLTEQL